MAKIKLQMLQNCYMQYSKWLCYTQHLLLVKKLIVSRWQWIINNWC